MLLLASAVIVWLQNLKVSFVLLLWVGKLGNFENHEGYADDSWDHRYITSGALTCPLFRIPEVRQDFSSNTNFSIVASQ